MDFPHSLRRKRRLTNVYFHLLLGQLLWFDLTRSNGRLWIQIQRLSNLNDALASFRWNLSLDDLLLNVVARFKQMIVRLDNRRSLRERSSDSCGRTRNILRQIYVVDTLHC